MATIKEQTEKTEQLKTTLDSKVIAIADEIKKQDNIDITRLSEVPDAIVQLKNSRKRWAEGGTLPVTLEKGGRFYAYTELPQLNFKPQIILISLKCSGGKNMTNVYVNINETFKFRYIPPCEKTYPASGIIMIDSNYGTGHSNGLSYGMGLMVEKNGYDSEKIMLVYNDYKTDISIAKINNWIAFE